MSGKVGKNRKRPVPSSTFKMKRLKVPDSISNEDISEDDNSNKKIKVKKLVTLSQPMLRNDLKIKLHSILSNWKPPLKNTPNENNEGCETTDSLQESETKLLKCDDSLSDSKKLQTIPLTNDTKLNTKADNFLNGDNYIINNNNHIEQKSLHQDQQEFNIHEFSTSPNQQISESSTAVPYKTVDFKDQMRKDISMHDTNAFEEVMKDKNSNAKSLEDSPNEQVNNDSEARIGFSTPEITRTPPTPPTLKISWLNSNGYDSDCNSTHNETLEHPILNRKSSNESDTHKEEKLLESEGVDSNELLNITKKSELETLIEDAHGSSLQTECELDVNALHSQLNSIEENVSTSVTQRDLSEELDPPKDLTHELKNFDFTPFHFIQEKNTSKSVTEREQAQECNPPREASQELMNVDFTPFHPTPLVAKMPRINWVRQLQDDKKRLQTVVREISQLNAMLTRAVRELWSERNPL